MIKNSNWGSTCCKARVIVVGNIDEGTYRWRCTQCEQICNAEPIVDKLQSEPPISLGEQLDNRLRDIEKRISELEGKDD